MPGNTAVISALRGPRTAKVTPSVSASARQCQHTPSSNESRDLGLLARHVRGMDSRPGISEENCGKLRNESRTGSSQVEPDLPVPDEFFHTFCLYIHTSVCMYEYVQRTQRTQSSLRSSKSTFRRVVSIADSKMAICPVQEKQK